jgi:hypothetical protein
VDKVLHKPVRKDHPIPLLDEIEQFGPYKVEVVEAEFVGSLTDVFRPLLGAPGGRGHNDRYTSVLEGFEEAKRWVGIIDWIK